MSDSRMPETGVWHTVFSSVTLTSTFYLDALFSSSPSDKKSGHREGILVRKKKKMLIIKKICRYKVASRIIN